MELRTESRVALTNKTGVTAINLSAGQHIKIETGPQGQDILNVTVPAGTKWIVELLVKIKETPE